MRSRAGCAISFEVLRVRRAAGHDLDDEHRHLLALLPEGGRLRQRCHWRIDGRVMGENLPLQLLELVARLDAQLLG